MEGEDLPRWNTVRLMAHEHTVLVVEAIVRVGDIYKDDSDKRSEHVVQLAGVSPVSRIEIAVSEAS